jgi:hypothetical protein
MLKKLFYAFVITNGSSCMGQSYPEDDWSHVLYDRELDALFERACEFYGSHTYWKEFARMFQFECYVVSNKLYGELVIPDPNKNERIYDFFGKNGIESNVEFMEWHKEETEAFVNKVKNSEVFKQERKKLEIKKEITKTKRGGRTQSSIYYD